MTQARDVPQDLSIKSAIGAAVLILLVIGFLASFLPVFNDPQKIANEEYVAKVVELVSSGPPFQAQLVVEKVSLTTWFWGLNWKVTDLYGTLVVEQPEGAEYLGYAPGSSAINWRLRDGKGLTWMPDFRLKGRSGVYPTIRITGVLVK